MPSTNLELYLESIHSTKPPYNCPYQNCSKSFRKLDQIKMHLNNVDHADLSPTMTNNNSNSKKNSTTEKSTRKTLDKRITRDMKNEDSQPSTSTASSTKKMIQFKHKEQLINLPVDQEMSMSFIPKNPNANNVTTPEKKHKRKSAKWTKSTTKHANNLQVKLPEPSYRLVNGVDNDYKEPTDSSAAYYRYLDDSIEEEDQIKVEYDMDEEDAVWLDMMNQKRREERLLDVSVETFELIMDRFEKESFFQSQSSGAGMSSTIDEDAVCSICFDGECHNSNAILFCDMCNIAVHQECYGVPYIPEGLWLCRRCLRSPSTAVDCIFCPNKGGAFKHTDDHRWAHVICALWIPEVGFSNSVFLEPVDSIKAIPAARWKLLCSICQQKNVGACIQCYKNNCYTAFHVTCAQQAGLYMKIEAVKEYNQQGRVVMNVRKSAYCHQHAPVSKNGCSNGLYLSGDEDSKSETVNNQKDNKKMRNKMKNARKVFSDKRTSSSVVSIPTIPNERLSKISELVSFPRRNEFLVRLYAYWKLKRQSRNGMSLLRRLQYTNLIMRIDLNKDKSKRESSKIRSQHKKFLQLRHDLERARLLLELLRKRERIKLKLIKETRAIHIYRLNPFKMFLLQILDRIVEKDTNQFFLEPVNPEDVPDYLDFIKNPMDLGTMRKKVEDYQYTSFDDFERDLNLIIENCTYYNEKDTIWYKAALKLKTHIDSILDEHRPFLVNYDQKTGLHVDELINFQQQQQSTSQQKNDSENIKS